MTYRITEAEIRANAEIAKDCATQGYVIESPWDLVGNHSDHRWTRELAEIFARHLWKPHPDRVLEGLMFAGAWLETKDLFLAPVVAILRKHGDSFLGQSAANALLTMADKSDTELFKDLIMDKSVGVSRSLLIDGYAKLAKKDAIPALRANVTDPIVRSYVLKNLSKLGDQTIRGDLIELAKHPDAYHRKIARDSLARLDKKASKAKTLN
jgi:hypothetical protein